MARRAGSPSGAKRGRKPAAKAAPLQAKTPRKQTAKQAVPRMPHNGSNGSSNTDKQLEGLTTRLVNLANEKAELSADMAELYSTAKDKGYDTKVLRRTVKILCESHEARSERLRVEEESDIQLHALGQLSDTPLGRAAVSAAEGRSPPPKAAAEADELEGPGRYGDDA
jgi:uncharacterized protein (UPF0335 family)